MNPKADTTNWLSLAAGKARSLPYLSALPISDSHLGFTTEVKMISG